MSTQQQQLQQMQQQLSEMQARLQWHQEVAQHQQQIGGDQGRQPFMVSTQDMGEVVTTTRGTPGAGPIPIGPQQTIRAGLHRAGLNTASMGIADGDFGSLYTPQQAQQGTGPEMDLLMGMRLMGEASKRKRSTNWLRPDCHIDKDKKFEDMSYYELVHGMHEVNKCIERAKIPGVTTEGYGQHMSFVTLKGQS